MILRSLLIWLAIVPLAILNGIFRESVLKRWSGEITARLASGLLLCALVFGLVYFSIPFVGRGTGLDFAAIGLVWLICTVIFECSFGRVAAKKSWSEILAPYFFKGGDIWPLVLLFIAASPFVAARLRGLI